MEKTEFYLYLSDELEDFEIPLEELDSLVGGLSLTEAMISSTLLMFTVTQSLTLFGDSLNAVGRSKLRDSTNASIHSDMELVRHEVSSWMKEDNPHFNSYSPSLDSCEKGNLAEELLQDPNVSLQEGTKQIGSVTRTVDLDPSNSNLIRIRYQTADGNRVRVERGATLSVDAQAWCP